jgi:hypothetical protein
VSPLRLGGLRGKKSTPSIGWEVPLRSHWLASGSWTEYMWNNDLELSHLATIHMHLFLNGILILFSAFSLLYLFCVKVMFHSSFYNQ